MKKAAGKIVVITGASSGAGKAIAIELAKEEACLVLAARRQQALEEVAIECKRFGAETIIKTTDVKEMVEMNDLAKFALDHFGRIDVWVNNAGVLAAGAVDEIPSEINDDVIRTNLLGYIHGAQAVIPIFKKQAHGILINNISVGGWIATPYMAAYCASKFGLRGFFEALKGELLPYKNIHICDLYPAFLDTPGMQHSANFTGKHLRPAPPVYDPALVARAVVARIVNPKEVTPIGSAALLLKIAYGVLPSSSRNVTGRLIRTYLKNAQPSEETNGNILAPVDFGTSIYGGWEPYYNTAIRKRAPWIFAGLAIISLLAINRR